MKRLWKRFLCLLLVLTLVLGSVGCSNKTEEPDVSTSAPLDGVWTNPYSDVDDNLWSYGFITRLNQAGILPDAHELRPGEVEQRGNFAACLYAMAKALDGDLKAPKDTEESPFTDVSVDDPNFEGILWAKENGIIYGVSDTEFVPQGSVTRETACVMLIRFARYAGMKLVQQNEPIQFRDSLQVSDYARSGVMACQMAGIVNGYPDKYFRPANEITREQCAVMLCGILDAMATEAGRDAVLVSTEDGAYDSVYAEYAAIFSAPVPESEGVDVSYFDHVVFVGDSVSVKLQYYCASTKALGNATFLCAGSLSATNALWEVSSDSPHPTYQGQKMSIEDSIALSGADKVYIMLGMNNISFGLEDSTGDMVKLIDRILEKSPDVAIVIQAVTPMTAASRTANEWLNNDSIQTYNQRMQEICRERGWYYLAVDEAFKDADGNLIAEYCSDPEEMGIHFTTEAAAVWVEYLKTHVPEVLK